MKQLCGAHFSQFSFKWFCFKPKSCHVKLFTFEPGCVISENDFAQYFIPLADIIPLFPCQILLERCI